MCDVDRLLARAREMAEKARQEMVRRGCVPMVAASAADNLLQTEIEKIKRRMTKGKKSRKAVLPT